MRLFAAVCLLLFSISVNAQERYLVDWDAVGEETLTLLSDLVRIDTTNPPGNETEVAEYLQAILAAEGIDSELYALDPNRANLVTRIKGNGSKRPILIMGHTDVVGVDAEQWDKDPFSGLREGGWVYGRGTLDDKDNVAAGLMVILMLKRYGVELDRDVIFLAEAGEEGTPQVGINFMVENHWDAIAAEYCLAEGGGGILEEQGVKVVEVQTTEKLIRRAILVAKGTAGHGSRPSEDNPVAAIARAVAKADAWQTEVRLNETTKTYFDRLASVAKPDDAFRFRNIDNPDEIEAIQQHFLENDAYYYSTIRTSVVPTIIDAGFRKNVIPSRATAMLDIRMLPDEDVDAFYEKLAVVIDEPNVKIIPEEIYRPAAPPSGLDNEMFETLERVAGEMYPDAIVVPKMSTGGTDMSQVRAMGVPAYGVGPNRSRAELNSGNGAHGDNERVSEEALVEFLQFMWSVVIDVAATK
ncbi:MAG: M20/M25/M40 family metallo-hydrolase [Woeseiaceae bacterium]|nr:M20/M25/M40 family metallo-hydrolase [Woeseiaceae bacterium]NIP20947.1 M20/M25/M40 family metallo-hydrolase [Woeseiaceae bacterium]NIS89714.1 M20/M25/M40 family metallo-hydrolase [Woeseiaceae bacterium]